MKRDYKSYSLRETPLTYLFMDQLQKTCHANLKYSENRKYVEGQVKR